VTRKRIERAGETHGTVYIVGRHPLNERHWAIRWGCCGREQEVSAERLSVIMRTLPVRCINCVREHAKENPEYYSTKAVRDRELRVAQKMAENRPEEKVTPTVKDRLGRLWPELGTLGPRWS
jgi:hypothetical protein